jgi:hypothetical protein
MIAVVSCDPWNDGRAHLRARFGVVNVIQIVACVCVVGLGSSAASAREQQAGLSAFDIFSRSMPRPPRLVPRKSPGEKIGPAIAAAPTKDPRVRTSAAHGVRQVAAHPTASMFPPVAPLE